MTRELYDPAAWPITPAAREACATITTHLTGLGWRALGEIYAPELVAAYADPTALARLELRPDPAAPGQVTARLVRLSSPTVEAARPEPHWELTVTGPRPDPQLLVRAAHLAPGPRGPIADVLAPAVHSHGWRPVPGDPHTDPFARAISPDGRVTVAYGPHDAPHDDHRRAPETWSVTATDQNGKHAWTLVGSAKMPAHLLYATLLDPQPLAGLEPAAQHRLGQLLTATGFTAHPWTQIELPGGSWQLADLYLREHPHGGTVCVTATTTGVQRGPEIEVALLGGDADPDDARHARTRRAALGGHAAFTHHTSPEAVLAYLAALAFAPHTDPVAGVRPALLTACLHEIRTDQSAHPAWARAAAETYAAFTSYRPDQLDLDDPATTEEVATDLFLLTELE